MKILLTIFSTFCFLYLHAGENTGAYAYESTPDSTAHLKHRHPLPLECSKIKAGNSKDADVKDLYGDGLFDKNDGHGGARYFTDSDRRVILKTVIGVDAVIEEVELTLFPFPFEAVKDKLATVPIAKKLNDNPQLIKGVKFGDSAEIIVAAFGVPNKISNEGGIRTFVYQDDYNNWEEVLFYTATFEFNNDKLQRISIYNGE